LFYLIDHVEEADLLALSTVLEEMDKAKISPASLSFGEGMELQSQLASY
jgi:hypothetical protein